MEKPRVVLIGGPPGGGKTTLSLALSRRLDAEWLTIDDIAAAVKGITTPHSHPGLHAGTRAATGVDSFEYFTTAPVDRLIADAAENHEAMWPAVERVIRQRASFGPSVVIEGWFMRPEKVAALELENVTSFWLSVDEAVLEQRERDVDFFDRSSDPERMLRNFLGRSFWHNGLIRQQAEKLGLPVLYQDGEASVDDLCETVMERLDEGG